jgi:hypothetical protein
MVTVHRFKLLDPATGDWVVQLAKSTEDHIAALGGSIIEFTTEAVDQSMIDADGRYIPAR